eukprot:6197622-Pleurochrysis_carterae.AAC.3
MRVPVCVRHVRASVRACGMRAWRGVRACVAWPGVRASRVSERRVCARALVPPRIGACAINQRCVAHLLSRGGDVRGQREHHVEDAEQLSAQPVYRHAARTQQQPTDLRVRGRKQERGAEMIE